MLRNDNANRYIQNLIDKLAASQTEISFPLKDCQTKLTANDYVQFLEALNQKLLKNKNIADNLILVAEASTSELLKGLEQYFENKNALPLSIKKLTLRIKTFELSHSDPLLNSMPKKQSLNIIIEDDTMTETIASELATHICNDKDKWIDLVLPSIYQHTEYQQALDEAYSDKIKDINTESLNTQFPDLDGKRDVAKARKRIRTKGNPTVDVEMQQQQQAEMAIDSAREDKEQIEPGENESELLNKLEFLSWVKNQKNLDLPYLSQAKAAAIWDDWEGLTGIGEDSTLKLSVKAAEELLLNQSRFMYGIDFNHPPAGFKVKFQTSNSGKIHRKLYFDKTYKQLGGYNPIQVQCDEVPKAKPLSNSFIRKWHENKLQHSASDQILAKQWETIQKQPYNRELHQVFKQYLPKLRQMSDWTLEYLFKIFDNNDANSFDAIAFAYLLKNIDEIVAAANVNSAAISQDVAGKIKVDNNFLTYFIISPGMNNGNSTSLSNLIETKNTIIEAIKEKVPQINEDALLQVYDQYGETGIQIINQMIDDNLDVFNELNQILFSKMETLIPLLTPEYQVAIRGIKGFTKEQRIWWNILLEQHCNSQGVDHLPHLFNAFKEFSNKVLEYELNFYVPCEFENVKSLPVALSRILTLMENTKKEERLCQWKKVSELDWGSKAMGKAMNDREYNGQKWTWYHPEQKITLEYIDKQLNRYSNQKNWKTIKNPQDYRKRFFRYVGYKAENGNLAMAFYEDAHTILLNNTILSDEIKAYLYSMIADSTTQSETVATIIKGSDEAVRDLEEIIRIFVDLPVSAVIKATTEDEIIRIEICKMLYKLESIPPLPVLAKLIQFVADSMSDICSSLINGNALIAAFGQLNKFSQRYGNHFYTGMKDYTDNDYKNDKKLFYKYLNVVQILQDTQFQDRELERNIIHLISSFGLDSEENNNLQKIFNSINTDNPEIKKCIEILGDLSIRDSSNKLDLNDLNTIIEKIRNSLISENEVFASLASIQIKNVDLAAYFPKDYFSLTTNISSDVDLKISNHFDKHCQDIVKNILGNFKDRLDQKRYDEVLDLLIRISSQLDANSQLAFFDNLSHEKLYQGIRIERFINVLKIISRNRATDYFDYFITECMKDCTDSKAASVEGVYEKAQLYMEHLSPSLKKIKNNKIPNDVVLKLSTSILLNASVTELSLIQDIETDTDHVYISQEKRLQKLDADIKNNAKLDLSGISHGIGEFISCVHSESDEAAYSLDETIRIKSQADELLENKNSRNFAEYLMKNPNPAVLQAIYWIYKASGGSDDDINALAGFDLVRSAKSFPFFFEENPPPHVESTITKYPSLIQDKDFLPGLFKNPDFQQKLCSKPVTDALDNVTSNYEENQLVTIFGAIAQDLDSFKSFTESVTKSKAELEKLQSCRKSYAGLFANLFKKINLVCDKNKISKMKFLELVKTYISHYKSNGMKQGILPYLLDFTTRIDDFFSKIDDKNAVLSLCVQFNEQHDEKKIKDYQPENLLDLIECINKVSDAATQLLLVNVATSLIVKDLYNFSDFQKLVELIQEDESGILSMFLDGIYQKDKPHPDLNTLMEEWYLPYKPALELSAYTKEEQDAIRTKSLTILIDNIRSHYEIFDACPYPQVRNGDEFDNGFHLDFSRKQLKEFRKLNKIPESEKDKFILTEKDLLALNEFCGEDFENQAEKNGKKRANYNNTSTATLLKTFHSIQKKSQRRENIDVIELLAVTAALLKKSTGMEIHTTQYMAILVSLKSGGRIGLNIDTGEGKSRISMIALACLCTIYKTPNFLTKDLLLATRDYVDFQPFFNMLNIPTAMHFADSEPEMYRKDGINFSDPNNHLLFIGQAIVNGRLEDVMEMDKEKRATFLDESDVPFYDMANTRCNYSMEGDESIKDMQWIYDILIDFFDGNKDNFDLYENVFKCRESFVDYALARCKPDQSARIRALSNTQIDQWLESAVAAFDIEYNINYNFATDILVSASDGLKNRSVVQVLLDHQIAVGSKLSFGAHQCLEALSDKRRRQVKHTDKLDEFILALRNCHSSFDRSSEKQIIYSSTADNYLHEFADSTFISVSGSQGPDELRKEIGLFHGVEFYDLPRHRGLNRKPVKFHIVDNENDKLKTYMHLINEGDKVDQSFLVVCENGNKSADTEKLLTHQYPAESERLQRIHAGHTPDEINSRIRLAGKKNKITVSTPMVGRGTDVKPEGRGGLNVIIPYLPESRDFVQIPGRSGRQGADGEVHVVLTKDELKALAHKYVPSADIETILKQDDAERDYQLEILVKKINIGREKEKQVNRLIKNAVGNFRYYLTRSFFKGHKIPAAKILEPEWIVFNGEADKIWNQYLNSIQGILRNDKLWHQSWNDDPDEIFNARHLLKNALSNVQVELDKYQEKIHQSWDAFADVCKELKLPDKLPMITLTDTVYQCLEITPPLNVTCLYDREIRSKISVKDAEILNKNAFYRPYLQIQPFIKDGQVQYKYILDSTWEMKQLFNNIIEFEKAFSEPTLNGMHELTLDVVVDVEATIRGNASLEDMALSYQQHLLDRLSSSCDRIELNIIDRDAFFSIFHADQECRIQLTQEMLYTQKNEIDAYVHSLLTSAKNPMPDELKSRMGTRLLPLQKRVDLFINKVTPLYEPVFSYFNSSDNTNSPIAQLKRNLKKAENDESAYKYSERYVDLSAKNEEINEAHITALDECGLLKQNISVIEPEKELRLSADSNENEKELLVSSELRRRNVNPEIKENNIQDQRNSEGNNSSSDSDLDFDSDSSDKKIANIQYNPVSKKSRSIPPWMIYALVGFVAGLVVIGLIAFCIFTYGAGLPALLAIGHGAVGFFAGAAAAATVAASAPATVGILVTVGLAILAGFTLLAAGVGKLFEAIFDMCCPSQIPDVPDNVNENEHRKYENSHSLVNEAFSMQQPEPRPGIISDDQSNINNPDLITHIVSPSEGQATKSIRVDQSQGESKGKSVSQSGLFGQTQGVTPLIIGNSQKNELEDQKNRQTLLQLTGQDADHDVKSVSQHTKTTTL